MSVSSTRPTINYNLIRTTLQKLIGESNIDVANLGLKIEQGSKQANKLGQAGSLANAVGLSIQLDAYSKCKEINDCRSKIEDAKNRLAELRNNLDILGWK